MTPPNLVAPVARLLPFVLVIPAFALAGCSGATGAVTHLEVRFSGQGTDVTYDLRSDLDARPTQAQYDRDGVPHPDAYTAHDQLEDWSRETRKTYATSSFPDTGFGAGYFLTGLDGVNADGASAYWSLSVNGQESSQGMSQARVAEGDTVTWTYTLVDAGARLDPNPLGATVDPPAATQTETATISGSVDQPATISLDGGPSIEVAAGRWNLTSPPLAYGPNPTKLRIEDGVHAIVRDVVFVRLANATINAVFTASPGREDLGHVVWFDPSRLASAPMYEGTDADRATTYSVHDLMVDWTTQTGTQVTYGGPGAFGFSVDAIDGVGQPLDSSLPPYWCYTLNGESATLGISLQTVAPGDVVVWEYSTCV